MLARVALVGLLVSSALFAWTPWLGSAIRHPEIQATGSLTAGQHGDDVEETER